MTLHEYLRGIARELADNTREESRPIAHDLAEAEKAGDHKSAAMLKSKLQSLHQIVQNFKTYNPEKGRERPDCPWCWMMDTVASPIKAVPPPEDVLKPTSMDYFRCPTCGEDFGHDDTKRLVELGLRGKKS